MAHSERDLYLLKLADKHLNDLTEKTAIIGNPMAAGKAVKGFAKKFDVEGAMQVAGLIGAAVIVNNVADRIAEYVERKTMKSMKPVFFKKMLNKHPKLMNEDPEEVADLWDTLYQTSPRLAMDPIAAGAFITQNINLKTRQDFGGPTLDTYDTLSKIENNLKTDPNKGSDFAGLAKDIALIG